MSGFFVRGSIARPEEIGRVAGSLPDPIHRIPAGGGGNLINEAVITVGCNCLFCLSAQ
jgi:hypothetical protein